MGERKSTCRSPSHHHLQPESLPQTSLGMAVFPCTPVYIQMSSCEFNACLMQPYSIFKVGEG